MQRLVQSKFYQFRQNNSGGSFSYPAINVIVEALDVNHANSIAENNGVYFNGCDSGQDCDCCGDRWYPQYNESNATNSPMVYDEDAEDYHDEWAEENKVLSVLIIYLDGTRKEIP